MKSIVMNRNLLIVIVVFLILALIGGYFFISGRNSDTVEETGSVQQELPKISAEELGLEIIPSSDLKYIQFRVANLKDITHLEWEFTYDAIAPDTGDGGGGLVTQGFGGEAEIKPGESEFLSERRELGTCSTGGKCRFDTGIERVDLIVKVTKADGKVYQADLSKAL